MFPRDQTSKPVSFEKFLKPEEARYDSTVMAPATHNCGGAVSEAISIYQHKLWNSRMQSLLMFQVNWAWSLASFMQKTLLGWFWIKSTSSFIFQCILKLTLASFPSSPQPFRKVPPLTLQLLIHLAFLLAIYYTFYYYLKFVITKIAEFCFYFHVRF